jgi:hypothetical protein
MDKRTRNYTLALAVVSALAVALWIAESDAQERAESAQAKLDGLTRRAFEAEQRAGEAEKAAKRHRSPARDRVTAR